MAAVAEALEAAAGAEAAAVAAFVFDLADFAALALLVVVVVVVAAAALAAEPVVETPAGHLVNAPLASRHFVELAAAVFSVGQAMKWPDASRHCLALDFALTGPAPMTASAAVTATKIEA